MLRRASIKRKLTLIIMLSTSLALVLACAVFIGTERTMLRDGMVADLTSLAGVTGTNSAAALTFLDVESAETTLAALQAIPDVVSAGLYLSDGELFASYARQAEMALTLPQGPVEYRQRFTDDGLHIFEPIEVDGDVIGGIFISSDLHALNEHLERAVSAVALILVGVLPVTYLLASRLQQTVTRPILRLSKLASNVSRDKDFSLRIDKESDDEVGILTESFNDMLTQIQARASELRQSNGKTG